MTRIDRLTMLVAATLKPGLDYSEEFEIDSAVQRGLRLLKAIEFTDAMLNEASIARGIAANTKETTKR